MDKIFLKLLNMSLSASWLILAVIVLRLALRRAPAWQKCLLWAIVAFRLICPFSLKSAFSLVPDPQAVSREIIAQSGFEPYSVIEHADEPEKAFAVSGGASVPAAESRSSPAAEKSINAMEMIGAVWIAGVCAMAAYSLFSCLKIKIRLRETVPLRDGIFIGDAVDSPFIFGVISPKIYLPSDTDLERADYIIAHENAHISRRDYIWKPAGFFLLTVYWFNPLCWLAYVLFSRDIEQACDEKVIGKYGAEDRKAYSFALLESSCCRKTVQVCPLAFGELNVKERVKNVLNYKKPAFWISAASILLCAVLAVCFLTEPEKSEKAGPSEPETASSADAEPAKTAAPVQTLTDDELKEVRQELLEFAEPVRVAFFNPWQSKVEPAETKMSLEELVGNTDTWAAKRNVDTLLDDLDNKKYSVSNAVILFAKDGRELWIDDNRDCLVITKAEKDFKPSVYTCEYSGKEMCGILIDWARQKQSELNAAALETMDTAPFKMTYREPKPDEEYFYHGGYNKANGFYSWQDLKEVFEFEGPEVCRWFKFKPGWLPFEPNENINAWAKDKDGYYTRLVSEGSVLPDGKHVEGQPYMVECFFAPQFVNGGAMLLMYQSPEKITEEKWGELQIVKMEASQKINDRVDKYSFVVMFSPKDGYIAVVSGSSDMETIEHIAKEIEIIPTEKIVYGENAVDKYTFIDVGVG